jgi:hypothetical protein
MSGISQDAVLVDDCWKAHFQTPVNKHQLCTAHLERETKYLVQRYKAAWQVKATDSLQSIKAPFGTQDQ